MDLRLVNSVEVGEICCEVVDAYCELLDEVFEILFFMYDVFDELKQDGKILMVITHDLGASLTKCDSLLLLSKKIIANGSFKQVITTDNLKRAYGGTVLLLTGEEGE